MSPRRTSYRVVGEIEDMIAHQLKLLILLEEARRSAATPGEWRRLNEQTRHAEMVYNWLRDRRAEMRDGTPESD
jgi:hypothetical protein